MLIRIIFSDRTRISHCRGSILTHDHFQGTAYLPIQKAPKVAGFARGLSRRIRGHREVADVGDSAILKRSEFAS